MIEDLEKVKIRAWFPQAYIPRNNHRKWTYGASHLIPSKGGGFSLVEYNCHSFLLKLILLFFVIRSHIKDGKRWEVVPGLVMKCSIGC